MTDLYRDKVVQAWRTSGSRMDLDTWVKVVAKGRPEFKHAEDIYAPIPLCIKIAGSIQTSDGSVSISVAPTDPQWYGKLCSALEKMTKQRNVDVQTYMGTSIKDMTPVQLSRAGELDVVSSGKVVRIQSVVPPPLEMATDKKERLQAWWIKERDNLATEIAHNLKGRSTAEIACDTKRGGAIQTRIKQYIQAHTPDNMHWNEFVSTYGGDNIAKNMSPEQTLEFLSAGILHGIRVGLQANETQIRDFHATKDIGMEASLWKTTQATSSGYKDDFTMYRDIAEDTLALPAIGKGVVDTLLHGYERLQCGCGGKKKKKDRYRKKVGAFHPMAAYYSEIHYPIHGQLPGHIQSRFNRGEQFKEYPGDPNAAFDVFHMLMGQPLISVQSKMPELVPLSRKMPELVPIDSVRSQMPELVPIDSIGSEMPELVPIDSLGSQMPELVPIDSLGSQMPELVPIDSLGSKMPELVPIDSIGSQMPELVPIGTPLPSAMPELIPIEQIYGNLGEPIWEDDMPSLSDYL